MLKWQIYLLFLCSWIHVKLIQQLKETKTEKEMVHLSKWDTAAINAEGKVEISENRNLITNIYTEDKSQGNPSNPPEYYLTKKH